jgi:hypothetical protein
MTLWATRDGQKITIHGNLHLNAEILESSVQGFRVTEDAGHVKGLWGQLGDLIRQAEDESRLPAEVHEPQQGGF